MSGRRGGNGIHGGPPGSAARRAALLMGLLAPAAVLGISAALSGPVLTPSVEAVTGLPAADVMTETEIVAQDYSRFRHDTPQHTRMPCLVCHVRPDNRAAMRMPGHIPCASCHTQQFADNKHPICTICHTATDVKPFPPLRSFRTVFNHARHSRLANCATCHKPVSNGAALSVPARLAGHTTCFQCHGPQASAGGERLGSCSTCHLAGRRDRFSAASRAYSVNFSHSEHTRAGLSCSECHTVRPGARQVASPLVSMHFAPARTQSCGACHNNQRAFGGTDFKDCKRCHEGSTFRF